MNAMYAKYGLQGESFATLPDNHEYRVLKQKASGLVTLDIHKELAAITSATDTLHITVPTDGFSDPLLNYSPIPRFGILLSINGCVANTKNDLAGKAQVFATDITGGRYPLLRNRANKVDYALIAERAKESPLFTTLAAITYVFYGDQLAKGLQPIDTTLAGTLECWLCYLPKTPLIFLLQVKNEQGQEKLSRELCYYPTVDTPSKATFFHNETIDCQVKVSDPFRYFRSRWVCDLTHEDSTLRLTHHAGLSYAATKALLLHLIPKEIFFERFTEKNTLQNIKNRYDLYPQYQGIFYEHLIASILDQSLPLVALQDFFFKDAHRFDALETLSANWDDHDKAVFKPSMRLASMDAFVDALDELIAMRDPLLCATLVPPYQQSREGFANIQVTVTLEDKEGKKSELNANWHDNDEGMANASMFAKVNVKRGDKVENERRSR